MFAHAIHNLWVSKCGAEAKSLCPEFNQVSHTQLINYLHNVSFNDVDGFPFKFEDKTHDGPPRYSIISYMESEQNPGEILFEVFSTIIELGSTVNSLPLNILAFGLFNLNVIGQTRQLHL